MGGVLIGLAGSRSGGTPTNHNVFVGVSTIKSSSLYGYSPGNISGITYGAIDVPSKGVYPIDMVHDVLSSGVYANTVLRILGNHTVNSLLTTMTVDGTNVPLGAPSYSYTSTATVTMTIASPCVITWTGHTLAVGYPVMFTTTGALPTGMLAGRPYFVVSVATNTFTVSATKGGAAINTSGTQSGTHSCFYAPSTVWTGTTQTMGTFTTINPTVSVGTPCVVTRTAHGLTNGQRVGFAFGTTFPTGLAVNTPYYVVNAAANTFNLSLTSGGAAINTTGTSTGPFGLSLAKLVTLS